MKPPYSSYLIIAIVLLFAFGVSSCEGEPSSDATYFPDFSTCNCDFDSSFGEVICTEEGLWFRSPCFATCLGYTDTLTHVDSCSMDFNPQDTLSWPIQYLCRPIEPLPPIVAELSDNTVIFAMEDGSFLRGFPETRCRCLPPTVLISTPAGQIPLSELRVGDEVYTRNGHGEKVVEPVLQLSSVEVPKDYKLLHICLEDGRELSLSPQHPDETGQALYAMSTGAFLDGARILEKELQVYQGQETADLLPAGETGHYLANGIWIGSTLFSKKIITAQSEEILDD